MRIHPEIKYTFKDATVYGFAPDERCDVCKGEFFQQPITNQSRSGLYKIYCSERCAAVDHKRLYWDKDRHAHFNCKVCDLFQYRV